MNKIFKIIKVLALPLLLFLAACGGSTTGATGATGVIGVTGASPEDLSRFAGTWDVDYIMYADYYAEPPYVYEINDAGMVSGIKWGGCRGDDTAQIRGGRLSYQKGITCYMGGIGKNCDAVLRSDLTFTSDSVAQGRGRLVVTCDDSNGDMTAEVDLKANKR